MPVYDVFGNCVWLSRKHLKRPNSSIISRQPRAGLRKAILQKSGV